MKPPPFEYHDPRSLETRLPSSPRTATRRRPWRQSLVPLLNFRLARPDRLADINGIDELAYIRPGNGTLRIGALTPHSALECSAEAAEAVPLLRQAVRWVGHVQIRNRGAVDGSVAHADPAGELPVALAAPDARFHVCSAAAPTPVRAHAAEESLRGRRLDGDAVVEAAAAAIEGISLTGDIHGSADYRRELTRAMVRRALLAIAEGGEAR